MTVIFFLAHVPVPDVKRHLTVKLSDDVGVGFRHHSVKRGEDALASPLVYRPSVYLPDKFFEVGDTYRKEADGLPVTLPVRGGHIDAGALHGNL